MAGMVEEGTQPRWHDAIGQVIAGIGRVAPGDMQTLRDRVTRFAPMPTGQGVAQMDAACGAGYDFDYGEREIRRGPIWLHDRPSHDAVYDAAVVAHECGHAVMSWDDYLPRRLASCLSAYAKEWAANSYVAKWGFGGLLRWFYLHKAAEDFEGFLDVVWVLPGEGVCLETDDGSEKQLFRMARTWQLVPASLDGVDVIREFPIGWELCSNDRG